MAAACSRPRSTNRSTHIDGKDFMPIRFAAMSPVFVLAHPSLVATRIRELIALTQRPAKMHPPRCSISSQTAQR